MIANYARTGNTEPLVESRGKARFDGQRLDEILTGGLAVDADYDTAVDEL